MVLRVMVLAVSVSIDGDTAVNWGSGMMTIMANSSGSAYVYVRSNGVWSEQAKLTASDGAADDLFWPQRLDRRRYGCHWCSFAMMTMALTQARHMYMCAVMACGVNKQS